MMKLVPTHSLLPYFYRCVTVAIEYYDGWCPCLKTPGSVLSPGPVASRQTMASARRPHTRARTAREPELSHEAQREAATGAEVYDIKLVYGPLRVAALEDHIVFNYGPRANRLTRW